MPSISEQLSELEQVILCCQPLVEPLEELSSAVVECLKGGNKILTCGNGGSASDALHMAEELVGRYRANRIPLPAICLNADVTAITCIANDYAYEEVFSRQIEALAEPSDLVIGFTTSGQSASVVNAVAKAKEIGVKTVVITGKDGGKLKGKGDYEIIIPTQNTARIQEMHTWVLHVLLEAVEEAYVS